MKQTKTLMLGLAVLSGMLLPLSDANAWVAAARGGWGGRAVAVGGFHGGYAGGCYGCGAAAGAVAGMAVGAAIARSAYPAYSTYPSTVVVQQPTYADQGNLPIGTQLASLPSGVNSMVVNGNNYYQYGPTWYKPYYGSSGVYYEVVQAP